MKKRFVIVCLVSALALSCICAAGCIKSESDDSESSSKSVSVSSSETASSIDSVSSPEDVSDDASDSSPESIFGKWVYEGASGNIGYMEFRSDYTWYYGQVYNGKDSSVKAGDYTINGSSLTLNNDDSRKSVKYTYHISGDKMTLSSEGSATEHLKRYVPVTNTAPNNNLSSLTP